MLLYLLLKIVDFRLFGALVLTVLWPVLTTDVTERVVTFGAVYSSFSLSHSHFRLTLSTLPKLKRLFYRSSIKHNRTLPLMLLFQAPQTLSLQTVPFRLILQIHLKVFQLNLFWQVLVYSARQFHLLFTVQMWAYDTLTVLYFAYGVCIEA